MSGEQLLKQALSEVAALRFEQIPETRHIFSLRYRIRKHKLLRSLEHQPAPGQREHTGRIKLKYLLLAIIMACVLALAGFTGYYIISGFKFTTKPTNTQVLTTGWEKAPIFIEQCYSIDVPEEYNVYREETDSNLIYFIEYRNNDTFIRFEQYAKKSFNATYNTEGYDYEEIDDGKIKGFYIRWEDYGALVWDNGDYVLEIKSTLSKEETIELAKTARIR